MWAAIGESLPFALGLALSPFVIVTGLMLLLGKNGRVKSALLGLGWFVAISVLTTIGFLIVDATKEVSGEYTETGVHVVQLVFAVLFFALAALTWRKRSREDDAAEDAPATPESASKKPSLTSRLDGLSPLGALGVGAAQGFLVIKNIPLSLSAGAVFGEAGLAGAQAIVAVAVFAVVGTLGVIVPLAVALVGGERLTPALVSARGWFESNMSAITITVLLLLGALFLGQGLGILG
jgi:hypothetical protein